MGGPGRGALRTAARACVALGLAALSACRAYEYPGSEINVGVPVPETADVDAVVFLVGDAGLAIEGRSPMLEKLKSDVEAWSAALARDSAVSIIFLGDNVYPDGVHDRGHPSFPRDSIHLWSQIGLLSGEAALEHNTVGLFLTGNHDWGNMVGRRALERVHNLEAELVRAREQGPRVALLPPAGHPGPIVRDLRQNVRLVLMDSQWFLREDSEAARTIFFRDLRNALETAEDREIILLAHHPFATSGPHGVLASGTRSTGLLYLLQRSGTLVQDLNSPAYGSFRDRMRVTFQRTDRIPLVFAGGHDHSLQVLDGLQPGDPRNILVSGSGSKLSTISDTTGLRFGAVRPGYMSLVFRRDDTVDLFVTAGDPGRMLCPDSVDDQLTECMREGVASYEVVYSETLPTERPDSVVAEEANGEALITAAQPDSTQAAKSEVEALEEMNPTPAAVPPSRVPPGRDTVVASPGQEYPAGPIRRFLFGDLNRHLWEIEFPVPVLDLDSVGGGLTPTELSGGKQTLGLRLQGEDGMVYQFRSIVKDASRALPGMLQSGPVDDVVQDQMGAQFPLSAIVVADLLQAAGVLVARPTPVIMPDHPRLGEYRELFAGRMGWIEVRPDERENDRPGFASSSDVSGTAEMLEDVREDDEAYINEREFVRARLIDMFVNDWDRHQDNWRWAKFDEESGRERWDPIPRDRDWALARIDGLLPRLAGVFYPKYVSFGDEYPDVKRLNWAGSQTDRYVLGGVGREVFMEEARALQQAFTDSVIDAALHTLPAEYLAVEEERLRSALLNRRENLPRVTEEFYELLAGWVDTYGTIDSDSVDIRVGGDSVTVGLWRGDDRLPGFSRTYQADETHEVRVYMISGEDVVSVSGDTELPLRVRLVGEPAGVTLMHADSSRLLVREGQLEGFRHLSFHQTLLPEPVDRAEEGEDQDPELPKAAVLAWETRDWGSQWLASPALEYESEFGLKGGLKLTRLGFGFRQDPHASRLDVTGLLGLEPKRFTGKLDYERRLNLNGTALRIGFEGHTLQHSRFFGIGNDTPDEADESFNKGFRSHILLDASLAYLSPGESWSMWIGPRVERWGQMDEADYPLIFDSVDVYGANAFTQFGAQAGMRVDGRDEADMPHDGTLLTLEGRVFPGTGRLRGPHGGVTGTARTYFGLPGPLDPTLHVRFYGERVWGEPPYPNLAQLGGKASLPGYRTYRFLGDAAGSVSGLLRVTLLDLGVAGGIRIGGHGIGTIGRVWLDGVEDGGQAEHVGWGGGLFVRLQALERTAALSFVQGERGWRTYLGLGFPF